MNKDELIKRFYRGSRPELDAEETLLLGKLMTLKKQHSTSSGTVVNRNAGQLPENNPETDTPASDK